MFSSSLGSFFTLLRGQLVLMPLLDFGEWFLSGSWDKVMPLTFQSDNPWLDCRVEPDDTGRVEV
jgi:hypothetical protein